MAIVPKRAPVGPSLPAAAITREPARAAPSAASASGVSPNAANGSETGATITSRVIGEVAVAVRVERAIDAREQRGGAADEDAPVHRHDLQRQDLRARGDASEPGRPARTGDDAGHVGGVAGGIGRRIILARLFVTAFQGVRSPPRGTDARCRGRRRAVPRRRPCPSRRAPVPAGARPCRAPRASSRRRLPGRPGAPDRRRDAGIDGSLPMSARGT